MQINLFLRKIHEKHTYIQAHVVGRLENLMNGGGMFDDVTSYHFLARRVDKRTGRKDVLLIFYVPKGAKGGNGTRKVKTGEE